jgi:hypothetical protein
LVLLLALAAPLQASTAQWHWRKVQVPGAEGPLHAVALDVPTRRVAVADRQGALLGRWPLSSGDAEDWRRVARVEAVTDLHFDDRGALWIASLSGLWRLGSGGRLEERSPGAGGDARRVLRFTSLGGLHVAAGAGGAFISMPGSAWQRLSRGLPMGSFQAAALRRLEPAGSGSGWALWLLTGRDLWRVEVADHADGPRAGSARRVRIPGRPLEAVPVDITLDLVGSEVVVLYPRALARTLPGQLEARRWEIDFPVWPAGASARRITAGGAGQLWLASDGGLLGARALPGPWAGAASPLGSMPVAQVVSAGGGAVLAAGRGGLYHGRLQTPAEMTGSGAIPLTWPAEEPSLARVQSRALGYAGLSPDYFRRLRSGLGRRGWWPAIALRAGSRFDRDERSGRDQTFTYGELHDLRDVSLDHSRDFDASITLAWDLGEVVYPSDAPELSREARQLIGLRDNVLDEVNQLYFDRRRALLALDAHPDKRAPEAVALRLRAEELAAGLDAWTGGWFSRALVGEAGETAGVGLASKVDAP